MADIRESVRPNSFDLVFGPFTSSGYFAEKQHNLQVLRNVYQDLVPGDSARNRDAWKGAASTILEERHLCGISQRRPSAPSARNCGRLIRVAREWILMKKRKIPKIKIRARSLLRT